MAKRAKRRIQKGRFKRNAGERSELQGSIVPGQRYNKLMPFPKMGKPGSGYMAEARGRVFNVHKDERDKKYVARFKGTPNGVHEIRVRHDDVLNAFAEEQWVDLYSSLTICVKLFWKSGGQACMRKYELESMTYRTSMVYGNPERAKRAFSEARVKWSDPLPLVLDD